MYMNYKRVYSNIDDISQKLNFVHLFLRILSQHTTVTGKSTLEPKLEAMVWVNAKRYQTWSIFRLMPDVSALEALHQLRKLQKHPPKEQDNPTLIKLIEMILDGSRVIPLEDIYPLTTQLR